VKPSPLALAVQSAMLAKGYTQAELAKRARVPQPALSRWFAGSRGIRSESIDRVMVVLSLAARSV